MQTNYSIIETCFWLAIFIVFYAYAGYGLLIYILVKFKNAFSKQVDTKYLLSNDYEPEVAFVIPCYNESDCIAAKIENCLALDYPKHKLKIIAITDGSDDGSPEIIANFEQVKVLHETQRKGKSAAENRAMNHITSPIVIFSDANTILPPHAIKELIKHYQNPKVGAVSGEKRILKKDKDNASSSGEGFYWKYESLLKKLDSDLYSIVGAAGELFSFRRELYTTLEEDTILDDFVESLRITQQGYRVIYEPKAYAMETASENIKEELKRKIRICAGGWQAISRLTSIMNPFTNPVLAFQYISHRVLRWSIVPLMLIAAFLLNISLFSDGLFYQLVFYAQCAFYLMAMTGWYLENKQLKIKALFIPYYFFIMNYAVVLGFIRFIKNKQNAAWERSKRGSMINN